MLHSVTIAIVWTQLLGTTWEERTRIKDVRLAVNQSVHQVGTPGDVVFTFENPKGRKLTYLSDFNIYNVKDTKAPVYTYRIPTDVKVLAPGRPNQFKWDKRGKDGVWAPAGTYFASISAIAQSGAKPTVFDPMVALTPTGRVAGANLFPIAAQSVWRFRPQGAEDNKESEEIRIDRAAGAWHPLVTGFLGAGGQSVALQSSGAAVTAMLRGAGGAEITGDLFRFDRRVGESFTVNLPGLLEDATLKVAAVNAVVFTPVGKLAGCLRFDVVRSKPALRSFGAFWFAPGLGLVEYSSRVNDAVGRGWRVFQLWRATVVGSDGQRYSMGPHSDLF